MERDVDGAGDAGRVVLVGAAYVEDDDLAVVAHLGEVGEGRGRERAQLRRSLQSSGLPVACAAGRSMPIRTSSRWASATSSAALAEQRDRGAPGDEPAEVGREAAVEPEVERAGGVPGGERGAVAQVDDPLAGLDAAAQLGGVGERRAG